jgi:hypothetical protein
MNKGLLACFALAFFYTPGKASAQFNDARAYDNTPIGVSQLELNYTYVRSNASLDPSLAISGANLNLNQGTVGYTYYFGVFHRLIWVEAAVPLAGLDGSIAGTNVHGSISGAGDSCYQLAMLLKGGPALGIEQFASYKPATSLGLSLTITAPTGLYNSDKILNLGSDRWSFKPEIALSHPFGPDQKWEFDAYGNASFTQTTLPIGGKRSSGRRHCLDLKDISAIRSTRESGCLWIRAIRFAPQRMSTASHKITRNKISSWAVS